MPIARHNVLFLCTGNSARSIMAEAILNSRGKPMFAAYSAGSHPSGTVRPEALAQLERAHISTAGLHSKSWEEFARPGAPELHFVFTVWTMLRRKYARSGRANPLPRTGEFQTQPRL